LQIPSLKPKYDEPLSTFAFSLNWRPYMTAVLVTRAMMTLCSLSDPNLPTARKLFLDLAALVEDLTGLEVWRCRLTPR